MTELYGVQLLMQSKNPLLFNKSEKQRLANLLLETNHFKLALGAESKRNISRLYKYVVLKLVSKRTFIYHMVEPDNHVYLIVKGKVGCFVPSSQANILGQQIWNQELQKKKIGDTQYTKTKEILSNYKNREEEAMLGSDLKYSKYYFSGNTCLYTKIRSFGAGDSFGGFTPFHLASFITEEDTSLLIIPARKYEKIFTTEVIRFQQVNSGLAEMFCDNEQDVCAQIQEDEMRALRDKGSIFQPIRMNPRVLDMVCYDFLPRNGAEDSRQKDEREINSRLQGDGEKDRSENGVQGIEQFEDKNGSQKSIERKSSGQLLPSSKNIIAIDSQQQINRSTSLDKQVIISKKPSFRDISTSNTSRFSRKTSIILSKQGPISSKGNVTEKTTSSFDIAAEGKIKKIPKFSFEEKKKGVQTMLQSSELSYHFEVQTFDEATTIYSEGDQVECFYLIKSGKAVLLKTGIDAYLKQFLEGDFFGFEDDGSKRIFSCQCEKNTVMYVVPKRSFENNLHTTLLPFFKNLIRFQKKQLLSAFKEQRESGLIRGLHRKVHTLTLRDMQYKMQLKKEITLELLNMMQHSNFTDRRRHISPNNKLSILNHIDENSKTPISERSTKKSVNFDQVSEKELRGSSLPQSSNHSLSSIGQMINPSDQFKLSQFYDPLKMQQAQRIVINEVKKAAQLKEEERKKNSNTVLERNTEVSFIKYQTINSILKNENKKSSQFLQIENTNPSKLAFPLNRDSEQILNPSENFYQIVSNSNNNSSCGFSNTPKTIRKYSSCDYSNLKTFSSIYHKKKHIIQITHLNEVPKGKINNSVSGTDTEVQGKKVCFDIENDQKNSMAKSLEKFSAKQSSENMPIIDDFDNDNHEDCGWLLQTALKHKNLDVGQIKSDIERQILSIPKIYQDKLWGPKAFRFNNSTKQSK